MSRFLAFLFLVSHLVLAAARPLDLIVGAYVPIKNVNDPNLRLMAEFAISQYNKMQSQQYRNHLVFRNVVRAEYQITAGTNFMLVIAAVNQSSPNPPQNYEAIVSFDLSETWKQLSSFRRSYKSNLPVTEFGQTQYMENLLLNNTNFFESLLYWGLGLPSYLMSLISMFM